MAAFWVLPPAICFALAGYLVVNDISGWGWFLVVGLLVFVYPAKPGASDDDG